MTPPALRLLTAVAEVPTVRSGLHLRVITEDFPDGPMDKNWPPNAADIGSVSGLEDSTCCRATKPVSHNY